MSIQEVSAEELIQLFHHYHQVLAPDFETEPNSAHPTWDDVPPQERERMIAAARLALLELGSAEERRNSRRYFAKPGEAEWGC